MENYQGDELGFFNRSTAGVKKKTKGKGGSYRQEKLYVMNRPKATERQTLYKHLFKRAKYFFLSNEKNVNV